MSEYIVSNIERDEDGAFIVTLATEDGTEVAKGQGATEEEAVADAKSKL